PTGAAEARSTQTQQRAGRARLVRRIRGAPEERLDRQAEPLLDRARELERDAVERLARLARRQPRTGAEDEEPIDVGRAYPVGIPDQRPAVADGPDPARRAHGVEDGLDAVERQLDRE